MCIIFTQRVEGVIVMKEKTDFALRLIALRKERKVSSEYIAESLGIKSATYRRYETDTMPKEKVLVAIADFYNVTTDYLLSGRLPKERDEKNTYPHFGTHSGGMKLESGNSYKTAGNIDDLSFEEAELINSLRTFSKADFNEIVNFINWKKSQSI